MHSVGKSAQTMYNWRFDLKLNTERIADVTFRTGGALSVYAIFGSLSFSISRGRTTTTRHGVVKVRPRNPIKRRGYVLYTRARVRKQTRSEMN